ncbi:MAG: hypothetical protein IJF09_00460 [Ruminiclostridium sp.]|nr:hypothetical protein [Ruminiclostridium sp.]
MRLFKRIAAAVCAIAVAVSVAGCADITKMGTVEDKGINAGVYLWFVNAAMDDAQTEVDNQLSDMGTSASKIENFSYFDYNVQEKPFAQFVEEKAIELVKQHVAIEKKAEELGLSLTAEEKNVIKENAKDLWKTEITYYGYSTGVTYGENYEKAGISRQSYTQVQLVNSLRNKLFDKYYEENGITPTDQKDIDVYFKDNYGRFEIIQVALKDAKGEAIDTEQGKADKLKQAEGYLDRLLKGEEYDTVFHDYEKYLEEQEKLAKEEEEKNNSNASSTTTSSKTESSEIEVDDTTSSGSSEEEEEDHDHDFLLNKADTSPSEAFIKWAFELKENEGKIYKDSTVYYVVVRRPIEERKDWQEEYRSDLLHEMKDGEFNEKLNEFAKDYKVDFSQSALDAYKPDKIKR